MRPRRRSVIKISDALRVGATVALELSLDPIEGRAVAIRALLPIAELCQAFDRCFVPLQVKATDKRLHLGLRWRAQHLGKNRWSIQQPTGDQTAAINRDQELLSGHESPPGFRLCAREA